MKWEEMPLRSRSYLKSRNAAASDSAMALYRSGEMYDDYRFRRIPNFGVGTYKAICHWLEVEFFPPKKCLECGGWFHARADAKFCREAHSSSWHARNWKILNSDRIKEAQRKTYNRKNATDPDYYLLANRRSRLKRAAFRVVEKFWSRSIRSPSALVLNPARRTGRAPVFPSESP